VEPDEAWKRIKTRSNDPRFLAVVKSLAKWREEEAQRRDVPRGRILKDDAVLEIGANKPQTREQLLASRSLQREGRKPEVCDAILAAVAAGEAAPPEEPPQNPRSFLRPKPGAQALSDLLKVLLKAKAEDLGVAQRLIASASELEDLAQGMRAGVKALDGWRMEAFGADALRLINGEIALSAGPSGVQVVETASMAEAAGE
jgi:ribonuclease D